MPPMSTLVLASSSPRRRALLAAAGYVFDVRAPDIDEAPALWERADALVLRLAFAKALAVASGVRDDAVVLGVDTTVDLDGDIVGKPRSKRHARELLARLGGRTHTVWSGVAVVAAPGTRATLELARTAVTFRELTRAEIAAYVDSGEPHGKAGAYAIQGKGRDLVASLDGSPTNVMGLPMERAVPLLERWGFGPAPAVT